MEKKKSFFTRLFVIKPMRYLIIFGISVCAFLLWFLLKQNYTLIGVYDAFSFTGMLMILLGLFSVVINLGAFDTFGYGFAYITHGIFSPKSEKKYADMVDYNEQKALKRESGSFPFGPYFIYGILYILIYIILLIISKAM